MAKLIIALVIILAGIAFYLLVLQKNEPAVVTNTLPKEQVDSSQRPLVSPSPVVSDTSPEDDLTALERDLDSLETPNNNFDQAVNSL